jgi:hypothetical protein
MRISYHRPLPAAVTITNKQEQELADSLALDLLLSQPPHETIEDLRAAVDRWSQNQAAPVEFTTEFDLVHLSFLLACATDYDSPINPAALKALKAWMHGSDLQQGFLLPPLWLNGKRYDGAVVEKRISAGRIRLELTRNGRKMRGIAAKEFHTVRSTRAGATAVCATAATAYAQWRSAVFSTAYNSEMTLAATRMALLRACAEIANLFGARLVEEAPYRLSVEESSTLY